MRIIGSVLVASIASMAFLSTTQADSAKSYMVGIRGTAESANYCAGALIAPRYVLTSNKCLPAIAKTENPWTTWESQVVVIGSKYQQGSNDGETIPVTRYYQHPDFDGKSFENDYLVLMLKHTTTRTPVTMLPWPYNNDDDPFKNTADTTVMGWGTGPKVNVTAELTTTHMMVLQSSECQNAIQVSSSDMCLQGTDKAATCKADYGSIVIATVRNGSEFLGGVIGNVEGCGKAGVPLKANALRQGRNWINPILLLILRISSAPSSNGSNEGLLIALRLCHGRHVEPFDPLHRELSPENQGLHCGDPTYRGGKKLLRRSARLEPIRAHVHPLLAGLASILRIYRHSAVRCDRLKLHQWPRQLITIKIAESFQHPEFNPLTFQNDYLLLRLDSATRAVPVTVLPNNYSYGYPFRIGSFQTVMRWGIPLAPASDVVCRRPWRSWTTWTPPRCLQSTTLSCLSSLMTEAWAVALIWAVPWSRRWAERNTSAVSSRPLTAATGAAPYAASSVEHARTWIRQILFQ